MFDKTKYLSNLFERYPALSVCKDDILSAYSILVSGFSREGKLLIAGNGGSASDSEHIVGELMKEFCLKRKVCSRQASMMKKINPEMGEILANNLQGALPAICLSGHSSLSTAYINDSIPDLVFAQQVNGYGKKNDVFLGISTSGNSKNIVYAAITAKAKGLKVIGLTGQQDSKISNLADCCIRVPETETFKIQEFHLPVYHCLCLMLEDYFFGK